MTQTVTVTVTPEFAAAIDASIAYAQSLDPAELARQIAEQNTPEKLAALRTRLNRYRRNRIAAEAAYYA